MIKFALSCDNGHDFESWFRDGVSFDKQSARGLVTCPVCGSAEVAKAIMAPAVVGAARPAGESPAPPAGLLDGKRRQLRAMVAEMRREIEANTDDVGRKFPEMARAIHDGEAPERAIRGQASPEEAKALIEDGVGVLPMPVLADEFN